MAYTSIELGFAAAVLARRGCGVFVERGIYEPPNGLGAGRQVGARAAPSVDPRDCARIESHFEAFGFEHSVERMP
jgi:hypothetical protein